VVTDISNNVITTKDISTFLYPNVYLFFADTTQCCVLGYHTYFFAPGSDPEQRWVLNYSSWISPGLFGAAFTDVTALSHEIAETYNDPFVVSDNVHNLTPFTLAPKGNCSDVLETGDVIEGLPDATFPINLNGFLPSAERRLTTVVQVRITIERVGRSLQLSRHDSPATSVTTSEV
jgi:hypothetical protein